MATTLEVYSKQEVDALLAERDRFYQQLFEAYVSSHPEWLPTAQALQVSGIKNRETLEKCKRASAPGKQEPGRITYRKVGTKCLYLRSSCIDYVQHKHGQPALAA